MTATLSRRIAAVGMILALVVAGGGLAAGQLADTETATDPQTTDIQDGSTVDELRNDSGEINVRINTTTAEKEEDVIAVLNVSDSGHPQNDSDIETWNDSWTAVQEEINPTGADAEATHFSLNISNRSTFDQVERDASENVQLNLNITANQSTSAENSTVWTLTADGSDRNAVIVAEGDDEVGTADQSGDFVTATLPDAVPAFGSTDDAPGAAEAEQNIGVNDTTDTIVVTVNNDSATDPFAEVSSASSGTFTPSAIVEVNGQPVAVFSQSVDTSDVSWLDSDEPYATVNSDGDKIEVYNANETFGDNPGEVSVRAVGNDAYGFDETFSLLQDYGASTTTAISEAAGAIDLNGDPFGGVV